MTAGTGGHLVPPGPYRTGPDSLFWQECPGSTGAAFEAFIVAGTGHPSPAICAPGRMSLRILGQCLDTQFFQIDTLSLVTPGYLHLIPGNQ
jgi:hypothetical protein